MDDRKFRMQNARTDRPTNQKKLPLVFGHVSDKLIIKMALEFLFCFIVSKENECHIMVTPLQWHKRLFDLQMFNVAPSVSCR